MSAEKGTTTASDTNRAGTFSSAMPAVPVAGGKVIAVRDGKIVFNPTGTNYEIELACPAYAGPSNKPVQGTIRVTARKVWTVPAGGNFIAPIFGPPKTIQGRVRSIGDGHMVVHAGTPITVELPDEDTVLEMADGPITQGRMVNVTAFPGGTFELAK